VDKIKHNKCFFNRYLVLTLDETAQALCEAHPVFQHCSLYYKILRPSDYRDADYFEIVFLKIKVVKVMVDQSKVAVFFFDADLIFFKLPPFPPQVKTAAPFVPPQLAH